MPPPHSTSQSQGKALMRTKLPRPSGPYGDQLQYSSGMGQATPEPLSIHAIHKPSATAKISSDSFNSVTLPPNASRWKTLTKK